MTHWQMYWLLILDNVSTASLILGVAMLVVTGMILSSSNESGSRSGMWFGIAFALITLFFFLAAIFLPSTKQAAAIWLVPKIINNEKVQEDAGDIYDLAISQLKKQLEIPEQKEKEE